MTVTFAPDWLTVPFQDWLTVWPFAKAHLTLQPLIEALPVLFTVTSPWKPPGHWLTTLYVAEHPLPPDGLAEGDGLGDGLREGDADGLGDGDGDGDGEAEGDADGLGDGDFDGEADGDGDGEDPPVRSP